MNTLHGSSLLDQEILLLQTHEKRRLDRKDLFYAILELWVRAGGWRGCTEALRAVPGTFKNSGTVGGTL